MMDYKKQIDDLLKSGNKDNVELAFTLNESMDIGYDFTDYVTFYDWIADNSTINYSDSKIHLLFIINRILCLYDKLFQGNIMF